PRPWSSSLFPYTTLFRSGIGANQIVERQRGRIRQDDAVPHHLHPALAVTHLAVVLTQNARTLRDQQEFSGGRVVDRFRHRGDHIDRKSTRLNSSHVKISY